MLLPALEAELVLDGCGRHWSGAMFARHYNPANTSCARRRDDQIVSLVAAAHESGCGTFETCRDVRYSVAIRGKADITRTSSTNAIAPSRKWALVQQRPDTL